MSLDSNTEKILVFILHAVGIGSHRLKYFADLRKKGLNFQMAKTMFMFQALILSKVFEKLSVLATIDTKIQLSDLRCI